MRVCVCVSHAAAHHFARCHYWRKFRSQTSDNMDRWKAEVEQKNREEKSRRETREEKELYRRKKRQMRQKVGKSRNTVFFQWFVEGRKVGSPKRRVRSQLARWWKIAHRCCAKHISKSKCTKHTTLSLEKEYFYTPFILRKFWWFTVNILLQCKLRLHVNLFRCFSKMI